MEEASGSFDRKRRHGKALELHWAGHQLRLHSSGFGVGSSGFKVRLKGRARLMILFGRGLAG